MDGAAAGRGGSGAGGGGGEAVAVDGGASVPTEAEALAIAGRLHAVLAELTPKCRAVLVMHRRDGMTYDEIAKALGISPSMVKKYLSVGIKHCSGRLQDLR